MKVDRKIRTTLLDTLNGGARDLRVYCLRCILDGLDRRLARDGRGAEEARLADELGAEHVECVWCV